MLFIKKSNLLNPEVAQVEYGIQRLAQVLILTFGL